MTQCNKPDIWEGKTPVRKFFNSIAVPQKIVTENLRLGQVPILFFFIFKREHHN